MNIRLIFTNTLVRLAFVDVGMFQLQVAESEWGKADFRLSLKPKKSWLSFMK